MALRLDEESHTYYDEESRPVAGVTGVLRAAGLASSRWYSELAAIRGKAVHRGCELILRGTLDWGTVADSIRPFLLRFKDFVATSGFELIAAEEIVDTVAMGMRYGGRLDLRGRLRGALAIVDLKSTTGSSMPAYTSVQTAAYALGFDPSYRRYGVLLTPTHWRLERFVDREDVRVWEAALRCYAWRKSHGEEVDGEQS